MRTVTAVIERDEKGHWLAHLAEEPRCHTWARSLTSARTAIREAAELWTEELGVATIDDLDMRDDVRGIPRVAEALQLAAEQARLTAQLAAVREHITTIAGELLRTERLSVRDVADVVGLSPGRISQIAPRSRTAASD